MEFEMRYGGKSNDGQEASNSQKEMKPSSYHRHTPQQIQHLEAFFKEYPHPDENQRKQLSRELGLETRQIKFWFQNKRTQTKTQSERADNNALRVDNEKIQCENLLMRESLKNVVCPSCGGPPFGDDDRRRTLHKLQLENAHLKEEHDKVTGLLAKYIGKPISQLQSLQSISGGNPLGPTPGSFTAGQGTGGYSPQINLLLGNSNLPALPYQITGIPEVEKSLMIETASSARDELIKLMHIDEPLWIKSSADGKQVLHRDSYEQLFPGSSHFRSSNTRVETSKEWTLVPFGGMHLVDMFWDPNKWVDLFPTMVTKANSIQKLVGGTVGGPGACLQLMYGQIHILSPLVPPREFYFLRYCERIEQSLWIIADVSFDCSKENQHIAPSRYWKLPSGCLIEELPNGSSKVTWVEHVEVDDKTLPHRLYRDLVSSCLVFGAERWVCSLRRMSERFTYASAESTWAGGVINTNAGKRSIMKLSHRMVKSFCSILNMSGKLNFPQLSEIHNSGVGVNVRKSVERGQPSGMIVSAATSLWLPLSPETVFGFFTDEKVRSQWDVLSNGNPVQEITQILYGSHPGNRIAVIRPFIPSENNMMMLQESCIDPLGSVIVYTPIDLPTLNIAINGGDSANIPILPSGFIISGDGRRFESGIGASTCSSGGSLLTIAFQILVCSLSPPKHMSMESVATVNTLISSTVQRIKNALNCSSLD